MRAVFGPIPQNVAFQPEMQGWKRAREPKAWMVRWVLSYPVALLLALAAAVFVVRYTPISADGMSLSALAALYVLLIAVHELVHASTHPDLGLTKASVVGFWPARFLFFAHYDAPRSKRSFLFSLIAPLLALSVLPIVLAGILGLAWWGLGAIAIINAASSCLDVLGFFIVLFGVLAGTEVQNQGWDTYWRPLIAGMPSNKRLQPTR
jgi:hypothetical protein